MRRADAPLAELFEEARLEWLQYAVRLRDRVAHLSRLKNLSSFVQKAHEGGGEVEIVYPTTPSGLRVDEYASALDRKLTLLLNGALGFVKQRLLAAQGEAK